MSTFSNQMLQFWEDIEDNLRCIRPRHLGKTLSRNDAASFLAAVLLQGMMLEDLLIDCVPDRRHLIVRWIKNTSALDVYDLSQMLKELTSYFRHYYDSDIIVPYDRFKRDLHVRFPFVGDFLSPIKREVELFLLVPDQSAFAVINQHLAFLSRLSLRDVDYTSECLREYLEMETDLSQIIYDPILLSSLNSIMREWLADLCFEGLVPKHGPGASARLGRCSLEQKYRNIGTDPAMRYFWKNIDPNYQLNFPVGEVPVERTCEVVFVPKSIQSFRTISMEPPSLMYLQQGCWEVLGKFLAKHRHLRHIIKIDDQSKNRDLACAGSYDRSYSTIDLSAASDCVTWRLARAVFRGTPMERVIYATRSKRALLPNGEQICLQKFAPMGSALCFPVECLIFACIAEHVVRKRGKSRPHTAYSIYGDDIVCRTEFSQEIIETLKQTGFRPNLSKTFSSTKNPFRESCGGEFFNGMDVSPFRLSRRFSAELPSTSSPNVWEAHKDLCNLAGQYGFSLVRRWALKRLLAVPQKVMPIFGHDPKRHLFSPTPTNHHLIIKEMKDWQCEVFVHGVIKSRYEDSQEEDDTIRYFEWHRLAHRRTRPVFIPDDLVIAHVTRSAPYLGSGRTPKS